MSNRKHNFILLLAGALLAVACSSTARAETPAETAASFGLLGTWAADCRLPPSAANSYAVYVAAPSGNISHERNYGSRVASGEIVRAALTAGGIDLVVYFPASAQTHRITVARTGDGRIRTVTESFANSNEYAIRDGKLLATGTDVPFQMKCR